VAPTAAAAAASAAVDASAPPPPSLKRSRSSEGGRSGNSGAAEKPAVAAEKAELARQLSSLTSEINDAMRAGDRAKVVLLMRRRDTLRRTGNTGASAAALVAEKPGGEVAEKPKADGKRARQGAARS